MEATQRRGARADTAFDAAVRAHRAGLADAAAAGYRAVLARRPAHAGAWGNLGIALRDRGAIAAAIACYRRSLELAPSTSALGNLANALKDAGRFDEAIASHRACIAADPADARARHNYAIALKAAGRLEEALAELDIACRLAPDAAGPCWDRALVLLALGRFAAGWEAYESRWRLKGHARQRPIAAWDGRPYPGRTLLVYPEQGFGDAILTARFLPAARARGGRVILACKPDLRRLFSALPGVDRLAGAADAPVAADIAAPVMSLPGLLGTNLDTLPPPPSLHVPPDSARPPPPAARALGRPLQGRDRLVGQRHLQGQRAAGNDARSLPPPGRSRRRTALQSAERTARGGTGDQRRRLDRRRPDRPLHRFRRYRRRRSRCSISSS